MSVAEQVAQLQHLDSADPNSPRRRQAKDRILTSLIRSLRGSTTTINAMETADDRITTDPAEVAESLRIHLAQGLQWRQHR